jgi:hypothetical protein
MGGAFGGKESQPALIACIAALMAQKTGRALQAAARPRRRHDHDRQAPRLRDRLRGGLRRRAGRGHRVHLRLALRHVGGSFRRGQRPHDVPLRQRLFPRAMEACQPPLQDAHGVQHGVPRLRRAAGHVRRSSTSWTRSRATSDRDPLEIRRRNFYGVDDRNVTPLPADGRGQYPGRDRRAARSSVGLPGATAGYPRVQRECDRFLKRGIA